MFTLTFKSEEEKKDYFDKLKDGEIVRHLKALGKVTTEEQLDSENILFANNVRLIYSAESRAVIINEKDQA